jgi:hypothetical protein
MRKIAIWWVTIAVALLGMPNFISSADAKENWKTYKLIKKDGTLNDSAWELANQQADDDSDIVTMTIDGERVKFVHKRGAGTSEKSIWLKLIKNPECVKGIQVEVTMGETEALSGDFRARIGTLAGAYGAAEDYAFSQMAVCNRNAEDGGDRLFGMLGVYDYFSGYAPLVDPVYTQFRQPKDVDGTTHLITMVLDHKKESVSYAVDGLGSATYNMPAKIVPAYGTHWGIGTRTNGDTNFGTVWFGNDVRLLIDSSCKPDTKRPKLKESDPQDGQKKIDLDAVNQSGLQIAFTFNEAMAAEPAGCEDGTCSAPCIEEYKKNNATGAWEPTGVQLCDYNYEPPKKFVFTGDGGDEHIYNTWYRFRVPENFFKDLTGNGNSEFWVEFKTEEASLEEAKVYLSNFLNDPSQENYDACITYLDYISPKTPEAHLFRAMANLMSVYQNDVIDFMKDQGLDLDALAAGSFDFEAFINGLLFSATLDADFADVLDELENILSDTYSDLSNASGAKTSFSPSGFDTVYLDDVDVKILKLFTSMFKSACFLAQSVDLTVADWMVESKHGGDVDIRTLIQNEEEISEAQQTGFLENNPDLLTVGDPNELGALRASIKKASKDLKAVYNALTAIGRKGREKRINNAFNLDSELDYYRLKAISLETIPSIIAAMDDRKTKIVVPEEEQVGATNKYNLYLQKLRPVSPESVTVFHILEGTASVRDLLGLDADLYEEAGKPKLYKSNINVFD